MKRLAALLVLFLLPHSSLHAELFTSKEFGFTANLPGEQAGPIRMDSAAGPIVAFMSADEKTQLIYQVSFCHTKEFEKLEKIDGRLQKRLLEGHFEGQKLLAEIADAKSSWMEGTTRPVLEISYRQVMPPEDGGGNLHTRKYVFMRGPAYISLSVTGTANNEALKLAARKFFDSFEMTGEAKLLPRK